MTEGSAAIAELRSRDLLIEKLRHQLAGLRRHRFGTRSESLDQLELTLEEAEIAQALEAPAGRPPVAESERRKPKRLPLPEHLPRSETVLSAGAECPSCGGRLKRVGADVTEELEYVAALYAIEDEARGHPPDDRVRIRQARARPIFDDLEAWLAAQRGIISAKIPLAGAIRYALGRLKRLRPYLDDGILEIDNNAAERAMRGVALGRKNWLFTGSSAGGRSAAVAYPDRDRQAQRRRPPGLARRRPRPHRRPQSLRAR